MQDSRIEGEINLQQIFETLSRYKFLISKFVLLGIFLSTLIAISTKKTWLGEFQIVLDNKDKESSILDKLNINANVSTIIGSNPVAANSLKTEVGILKSPSLLLEIFEFVKREKSLQDKNFSKLKYKDWLKSLSINLVDETSILNLKYKDKNKEIILPTLNKISRSYQDYSQKRRLRNLDLSSDYLKKQINEYKDKSKNSFENVQAFALKNDLDLNLNTNNSIKINRPEKISIVEQRTLALKKIRLYKEQLKYLNTIEKEADENIFLASEILGKDDKNLSTIKSIKEKILEIDNDLMRLRLVFKEDYPITQEKLKYRVSLIKLLNLNLKGIINAKLKDAKAIIKSNQREEGILAEFRLLQIQALKDSQVLNQLETQYRFVLLEKAQNKDPWELITNPTLLPNPIAPNKKSYVAFGIIFGLIVGSSYSLFESKKKNIIFSESDFDSFKELKLLGNLVMNNENFWAETLDFIISGPIKKARKDVAFFLIDSENQNSIDKISNFLNDKIKDKKFTITSDLREVVNYAAVVFLIELGSTKKTVLQETYKKISTQESSILGLITINND
tara:strand:- start:283 stop:1971 length:1689 start_codon:yes stop_codon:yes gene_type:complete